MQLPKLLSGTEEHPGDGVVVVIFAPFGADVTLSTFPDGASQSLAQHPLFKACEEIAASRVHVVALIDRVDEDTFLLEIPAGKPAATTVSSQGKLDMSAPETLAALLRRAHEAHPASAVVLTIEGHGAGFLPDIDATQVTAKNLTEGGRFQWQIGEKLSVPTTADGDPVLPAGVPVLPAGVPVLPGSMPLSTYALGAALKSAEDAGVPKLACIHFNNCFNMAVEVLHTVSPYAEFATGYENYNFFTAGEAYPAVFKKLAAAGSASTQQLAIWFATANHEILAAKGHHPTTGGAVQLSRLHSIVECIDDLSDALLAALRTAEGAERAGYVATIKQAIADSQHFDADGNLELQPPDELTDIRSLAHELSLPERNFGPFKVRQAAAALVEVLDKIKVYGDDGTPWMDENDEWNFSSPFLAMNIFLPDPMRIGRWDWRSPYYLDVNPDPTKPQVQRNIIDFVKVTDWVDFIIEYHKDVAFAGLLPAQLPEFPHFNRSYKPPRGRPNESCDEPKSS